MPRSATRQHKVQAARRKAAKNSRNLAPPPARAAKPARPIAIYHEHPRWFQPVFAELDRRNIPYVRLDAARHHFDLSPNGDQQYGLVFNRMSPSAWTRGNAHAIFYTLSYLAHLERSGVRVVNGSHAFRVETSKALQLSLLHSLGLPHPRSAVINHPSQAVEAARNLRFPIVIKPNIGGSGVGIVRFDSLEQLESAVATTPSSSASIPPASSRNSSPRAADTSPASKRSATNISTASKCSLPAKLSISAPWTSAKPPTAPKSKPPAWWKALKPACASKAIVRRRR